MRNNISVYHNDIRFRSCSFYIKLKGYTDIQFRDPLRLHAFYVWRVAITLSFVTAGYTHGRPWEVLGPIVLWKAYSVLCVLEQSRVDNSSAGFNWEQLVQSASGRLLWPFNLYSLSPSKSFFSMRIEIFGPDKSVFFFIIPNFLLESTKSVYSFLICILQIIVFLFNFATEIKKKCWNMWSYNKSPQTYHSKLLSSRYAVHFFFQQLLRDRVSDGVLEW